MSASIDLECLLQPIPGPLPCGPSLLDGDEYDVIREARRADEASQPRGDWEQELKKPDWPQVASLCEQVLATQSKDLQIAAWLGEAWIALDGMAGGTRAAALMERLCQRYWQDIHPLPRDGDHDFRSAPLEWADRYWSQALLLHVPLAGGHALTLAQWEAAMASDNEERKQKNGGPAAAKRMQDRIAALPIAELRAADHASGVWTAALWQLHGTLASLPQPSPPSRLGKLEEMLDKAIHVLHQCLQQHPDYNKPAAAMPDPSPAITPGAPPPVVQPTQLRGRDDAYRNLAQIADYLAQLEPHSPVPPLIRRAIEWGNMSFVDLMAELTSNNGELQRLLCRPPR